ncbi:MAG: transketolase family protein [Dorea sp.]|nr:transketolase family protein [Dorea sp.]
MAIIRNKGTELRKVLADELRSMMEENRNIIYMEADLGGALGTGDLFADFPGQAVNVGIMEANMVGAAAGMSVKGKIPFVHSFGTFASRRCADQAFLSGCYNGANVRILGSDPGISAEANGGTHMPLEDMAIYRAFPGMTVLDIAEPNLFRYALRETAKRYGMFYLRFPRKQRDAYYDTESFEIGKANVLRAGKDVTIAASGIEVTEALKAAEELKREGIEAEVIDVFTVKPIDEACICASAVKTGAVVTAENHNVIGGLGSAVAEVLAEHVPCPMKRVGVRDRFGEVGDLSYLSEQFGLTKESIIQAAKEVMDRKN